MADIKYISGLPYTQTLKDVVETIDSMLEEITETTENREDFLDQLQMHDSGLNLYQVNILYQEYKRLKKNQPTPQTRRS